MNRFGRIDRRTFAQIVVGAAGSAALAAPSETAKTRYLGVSCQTYIYEQIYGRKKERTDDHLEDILADLAKTGYGGIETMSRFVDTAAKAETFGALLARHKIRLAGIYSGARLHEKEPALRAIDGLVEAARLFRRLDCAVLVSNPDPIGREKTDAELATQAEMLNRLGGALKEVGASVHVHCHAPEFRSDAREFRSNLDHTDPALVFLNADVNWIQRGGADPYALLERYAQRIGSCHLRNSVDGVWSEALGPGDLDYGRVRALFEKSPHPMWLTVELAYEEKTKETRSLAENLAASRRFVREVFGV